jgi:hypothetical protein
VVRLLNQSKDPKTQVKKAHLEEMTLEMDGKLVVK